MTSCVCKGCSMRSKKRPPGVSFHSFPNDPVIAEKWFEFVRPGWTPTWRTRRLSRVCSLHFEEHCFDPQARMKVLSGIYSTMRNQLLPDAVPTIYPGSKVFEEKMCSISRSKETAGVTVHQEVDTPEVLSDQTQPTKSNCEFKTETISEVSPLNAFPGIATDNLPPWSFKLPKPDYPGYLAMLRQKSAASDTGTATVSKSGVGIAGPIEKVVWKNENLMVTCVTGDNAVEPGALIPVERNIEPSVCGVEEGEEILSSDSDDFSDNVKDDPDFTVDESSENEVCSASGSEGEDDYSDTTEESEEESAEPKTTHYVVLNDVDKTRVGKRSGEMINVIHPPPPEVEDISKRKCKQCLDPTAVHSHYECRSCLVQSHRLKTIQMHIRTVETYDPKCCDVCGEQFKNRVSLRKHTFRMHNSKVKCSYAGCNYKHSSKGRVKYHENTVHRNQQKYSCDWEGCGKMFKSRYSLKIHRRIHTNDKPIMCYLCGFSCRQKASLNWHMKSKHPNEPFPKMQEKNGKP